MNTIGNRIQEIMKELSTAQGERISLEAFGRPLSVGKGTVHKWINDTTKNMELLHLLAIEDHYGYTMRWVISGEGPKTVKEWRDQEAKKQISNKLERGELIDISELDDFARAGIKMTVSALRRPTDTQQSINPPSPKKEVFISNSVS